MAVENCGEWCDVLRGDCDAVSTLRGLCLGLSLVGCDLVLKGEVATDDVVVLVLVVFLLYFV